MRYMMTFERLEQALHRAEGVFSFIQTRKLWMIMAIPATRATQLNASLRLEDLGPKRDWLVHDERDRAEHPLRTLPSG